MATPEGATRRPAGQVPLGALRILLIVFTALAIALMAREVADSGVATLAPGARRLAVVATDGLAIDQIDATTGVRIRRLHQLPAASAERIIAVAPRPGTVDGTPLVVLSDSPGGARLWWLDDDGTRRSFPDGLAPRVQPSALARAMPAPLWSPDGAWVAWLDPDPAGTRLRALAWSASGPREGDQRHTSLPLGAGPSGGARLEAWRWLDAEPRRAAITVSDDRPSLWEVDVAREGARLVLERTDPRRLPGAVVDRADAEPAPGAPPWPRWFLVEPLGHEDTRASRLRWMDGDGGAGTVALPESLAGNRSRWWLDAYHSVVVIGDGTRAWTIHPDGSRVRLPGEIRHAVPLHRIDERWRRQPAPSGARQLE